MILLAGSITFVNTFGDRLRYARTLRKLSQAELAQACGVSQGTIGNYESGRRTRPQNIFRLAEVLEVSPAWLAMNTGPMELSSPSVFAEPPAPMVSTVWPLPGIDPARIWALSAQKREVLTQAVAGMLALLEEQS
ncbi:MAG TPA: helix-turn-helix transcriptional regulator [Burkholderiaceae bacterium]|nr:helix-turn-helix transcriptional regulator [Burkholderiaceae bacterium]